MALMIIGLLTLLSGMSGLIVGDSCLWNDPCGGSRPVPGTEGQGGTDSSISVTAARTNVARSANQTALLARNLMALYISIPVRVPSSSVVSPLINFPTNRDNITDEKAELQRDIDDVSKIAVFVEGVLDDERQNNTAVNYANEINSLERSLIASLCKIKMAAEAMSNSLAFNVSRNAMPNYMRNMTDISIRYRRDFSVFKFTDIYLRALSLSY